MRVPTLVMRCCISYYSYIKPQRNRIWDKRGAGCISYYSYIKPQPLLHHRCSGVRCISYYSYIKPQRTVTERIPTTCCISYYSYIKPQLSAKPSALLVVVYRTIPTSNHNQSEFDKEMVRVVYRTIPTSNHNFARWGLSWTGLYIVLFLHQTTTIPACWTLCSCCISYYSYIKPQRREDGSIRMLRCISYYSYIKPQPWCWWMIVQTVVYRTIPTSNHNT